MTKAAAPQNSSNGSDSDNIGGLEGTPFDGAVAEHPHAVHVVSVRLGYVYAGI